MRKVIAILLPALALFGCEEEQKGLAIDITIDSNIRIAGADRDIDRMDISVISDTGRRLKDGTRTWSVAGGNLRRTGTFLVEPATGDDSTALTITGTLIETTDDGPVLVAQRVIKPPFNPNQFTRVELKFDLACLGKSCWSNDDQPDCRVVNNEAMCLPIASCFSDADCNPGDVCGADSFCTGSTPDGG